MIGSVRGGNEPSLAYRKKELKPYKIKVLALFISIRKGYKRREMQNILHSFSEKLAT